LLICRGMKAWKRIMWGRRCSIGRSIGCS